MKLAVSEISKRFGGVTAVNEVSLECSSAEIVGLIGPNGAGKTTLLNMISSLLRVDSGTITLDGVPVHNIGPRRMALAGIARTFQNIRLCPNLTVSQNIMVAFITAQRHRRDRLGAMTVERLMQQIGIAHHAEHKVNELAYGTQRRVEIARALATGPKALLLDEPAAGLNPSETQALVELIRRINGEFGIGVLVVEHDMRLVMDLCRRIQVINRGRLVCEGTPAEVQADPAVIEAYLGTRRQGKAHA